MTASPQDWAWAACCDLIGAVVSFDPMAFLQATSRRVFLALLFALCLNAGGPTS
jgi:hypothetical protein